MRPWRREKASARDLLQALEHSDGRVTLRLDRDGSSVELHMEPASTAYGPRLGVYVREGITGIGTVTYYDPQTGDFGALGHGVSDARGALAAMETGKVYRARVTGVKPGRAGAPGQLLGDVQTQGVLGSIGRNTSFGIFGTCEGFAGEALPIAGAGKLHTGKAQILSNISGQEVETFSVEIVKLFDPEQHTGRDLMLHVTDPRLLEATGGIVAGMSGSPIPGAAHRAGSDAACNRPQTAGSHRGHRGGDVGQPHPSGRLSGGRRDPCAGQ